MSFSNTGLVAHAEKALKEKWYYGYGAYGEKATTALVNRLISNYPDENTPWRSYMLGAVSAGKRLCDCYGLVKSYLWWVSDSGDPAYNSNGFVDRNTAGAYNTAREKGGLSTLPELPGVILYMPGHVGVYCGKGRFIELKGGGAGASEGKISNGVITAGSKFTHWFKDTYIDYVRGDDEVVEKVTMLMNGKATTVNRILKDGRNYVMINDIPLLDLGYDANTKQVSMDVATKATAMSVNKKNVNIDTVMIQNRNYSQLNQLSDTGLFTLKYENGKVVMTK